MRAHVDVFTWSHDDMPGIHLKLACHKLAIIKNVKPVKQEKMCFNQKRYDIINAEVEKLLQAGFIREVNYSELISNGVMVKKTNEKWKISKGFIYFNKTCPKDSFHLPKINQLIDSTTGHGLLSLMDAFSGYN